MKSKKILGLVLILLILAIPFASANIFDDIAGFIGSFFGNNSAGLATGSSAGITSCQIISVSPTTVSVGQPVTVQVHYDNSSTTQPTQKLINCDAGAANNATSVSCNSTTKICTGTCTYNIINNTSGYAISATMDNVSCTSTPGNICTVASSASSRSVGGICKWVVKVVGNILNWPDLIVQSISFNPASPTINQPFNITVTIKNIGQGIDSDGKTVWTTGVSDNLGCKFSNGDTQQNLITLSGAIAKSSTKTTTFSNVKCTKSGTFPFRFTVDGDRYITESNETNNTNAKSVIIKTATCTKSGIKCTDSTGTFSDSCSGSTATSYACDASYLCQKTTTTCSNATQSCYYIKSGSAINAKCLNLTGFKNEINNSTIYCNATLCGGSSNLTTCPVCYSPSQNGLRAGSACQFDNTYSLDVAYSPDPGYFLRYARCFSNNTCGLETGNCRTKYGNSKPNCQTVVLNSVQVAQCIP